MTIENNTLPEKYSLLNGAALAYVGDAVYEVEVRKYVIELGKTHPNRLHRAAIKYVSAQGQAKVMHHWIEQTDFLTPEEIQIYKRGRNHKTNTKAKNASIGDYRQATGFEALLGWLKLSNQEERCQNLIQEAIQYINQEGA
ncbi:Mini-ribonuclease 3 [Facklamia miroungae]|uniref:Mini-ribonuclease 3 n=1 Tax=Facklamia miroungae TaxID=120956 RepID=A0A1G7SVP5_9LACT|nr:ribonuclease III domain-containing protein [Facklamia miroungae]SDG27041.1 ribonuclease-3 family protein [Facklamia miroungae]